MKIVEASSGKNKVVISRADWVSIGKKAGWINITANIDELYLLDKGVLYDDDGEEVFNMKMLIKIFDVLKGLGIKEIPKFKNAYEANNFLDNLQIETGINFGRVLEAKDDPMKQIRYKDTYKEREREKRNYMDQRNKDLKRGIF